MNFLDSITSNPIFPIATFLIGLLVSALFYYKARKTKNLKYCLRSYNLVKDHSSKYSDLSIKYRNIEVKNFTVTKLIFWNAGKETIDGKDITATEPLRVTIKSPFRILDASLLKANNNASQITLSPVLNNNVVDIKFDYLDYLNGGIINIIHEGTSSADIELSGKLKGVEKIINASDPQAPKHIHLFVPFPIHLNIVKYSSSKRRLFHGLSRIWFAIILGILYYLSIYADNKFPILNSLDSKTPKEIPIWVILIICALITMSGLYVMFQKTPNDLDLDEGI